MRCELDAGQQLPTIALRRAAPHPPGEGETCWLPMPGVILARAGEQIEQVRAAWRACRYERFLPEATRALLHRHADALTRLLPTATPFTMDDLIAAGLLPRHRRLVTFLLHLLREHGLATRLPPDGRWRLAVPADPAELTRGLLLRHPAFVTEVALAARMGRHLPAVLRGEHDLAELARQYPHDVTPVSRFTERLVRALLGQIVAAWPGDRPLRVLEIGGGTGATTAALLPLLPPRLTRYTFTDPDPSALTAARHRFSGSGLLDHQRLDLDTDPTSQGLATGAFDVVIAADTLHTARDLPAALDRVRSLLAPGGHLLAVETHHPGLLLAGPGALSHAWPAENDPLRPRTSLLRREQWAPLLRECGFTHVVQTSDDALPARDAFSVLLAARPRARARARDLPAAAPETRWIIVAEGEDGLPLAGAVAELLVAPDASASGGSASKGAVAVLAAQEPDRWRELMSGRPSDKRVAVTFVPSSGHRPHPGAEPPHTRALRTIARAITGLPTSINRSLYVVTRPSPPDTTLHETARSIAREHPGLHLPRINLHPGGNLATDARRLAHELLATPTDHEIVLTPRGRFVIHEQPPTPLTPCALDATAPAWTRTSPPPPPGPGMVTIEVHAATLHGRPGSGPGWWACAGRVTAVGTNVTGVRPGDRVSGLASGTPASHTLASARLLTRTPPGTSDAEAATVPLPHLHAHLALTVQAKLSPDETLLLHDDATGPGLAALRHALHCGARVIAAARTPAQRDLLLTLGAWRVLDALAPDAPRQVLRLTDGRGADVMAGPAPSGWERALNPDGRYVHLGAADPSDPDVFAEVMSGSATARDGGCLPLPFSAYPAARVRDALAAAREGSALGEIVLCFDPLDDPPAPFTK
ncbi:methyltransferase [Nonomuraea sp. PA05]|uniref:methyltransferase n=1 Tax=Nonomuraea sp. PA05 TaxID=2604466 RepID=UPI0011D48FA5|nr:methyltransferase [Nonomuraea sp. PA05]TYB56015.1 methyltransferase [Nonomuraea sp. PA05]